MPTFSLLLPLLGFFLFFAPSAPAKPADPGVVQASPPSLAQRLNVMKEKPKKILFTTNLDPATDLIMTLTQLNSDSILDLAHVLASLPSEVTLHIFYPQSFDALAARQMPKVSGVLERLKKDLKKIPRALEKTQFHPHVYLQYSWIQDVGEPFWFQGPEQATWRRGFLDLNRGNRPLAGESWPLDSKTILARGLPVEEPLLLVDALKTVFSFELLRLPLVPVQFDTETLGNQGGNLEILPGRFPLVGPAAPTAMRTLLDSLSGKKSLVFSSRQIQPAFTDQLFAIVPSATTCGFSLAVASPLSGLVTQRGLSVRRTHLEESVAESLFFFAKNSELKLDARVQLKDFNPQREPRRYRESEANEDLAGQMRVLDLMVQKVLQAEAEIIKAATLVQSTLKNEKVCADLELISLPVVAVMPSDADAEAGEEPEDFALQFYTPISGLVVLGAHLILGDFENSPAATRKELKTWTLDALEKGKIKAEHIHFVRAGFYGEGMGSIHSGTLVLRRPSEIVNSTAKSP